MGRLYSVTEECENTPLIGESMKARYLMLPVPNKSGKKTKEFMLALGTCSYTYKELSKKVSDVYRYHRYFRFLGKWPEMNKRVTNLRLRKPGWECGYEILDMDLI